MIRFFRRLRRYISLFLASFVMLVPVLLADRASAVIYDYNNLPHTVFVDGANDIVTVTLDPSKGGWSYWGPVSGSASGASVTFPESTSNWQAQYNFFDYGDGLDPTNIPDDTKVSVSLIYKWHEQVDQGSPNPTYVLWLRSYNTSYISIGQSKGNTTVGTANNDIVDLSCAYDAMPDASYLVPIVEIYGFTTDREMIVEVVKCTLTMSISSLYRQQQLTGKTNALLTEVNKQLEANGQKLDDIVQGNQQIQDNQQEIIDQQDQMMQRPVSPAAPDGAGSVSGYDDLENQIMQDMSGGFGNASTMQQSAAQILYQYANGFTFLTWVVNGFTDIPILHDILYVSICIGIFALLVGAISTVISGSHGSLDRGGGKK